MFSGQRKYILLIKPCLWISGCSSILWASSSPQGVCHQFQADALQTCPLSVSRWQYPISDFGLLFLSHRSLRTLPLAVAVCPLESNDTQWQHTGLVRLLLNTVRFWLLRCWQPLGNTRGEMQEGGCIHRSETELLNTTKIRGGWII